MVCGLNEYDGLCIRQLVQVDCCVCGICGCMCRAGQYSATDAGQHPTMCVYVYLCMCSCRPVQDGDYATAARIAFALKHPGRLLSVLQRAAASKRTAPGSVGGGGQEACQGVTTAVLESCMQSLDGHTQTMLPCQ